jgi:ethanolamine utilization protein EutQ (cupin superfamily)
MAKWVATRICARIAAAARSWKQQCPRDDDAQQLVVVLKKKKKLHDR